MSSHKTFIYILQPQQETFLGNTCTLNDTSDDTVMNLLFSKIICLDYFYYSITFEQMPIWRTKQKQRNLSIPIHYCFGVQPYRKVIRWSALASHAVPMRAWFVTTPTTKDQLWSVVQLFFVLGCSYSLMAVFILMRDLKRKDHKVHIQT